MDTDANPPHELKFVADVDGCSTFYGCIVSGCLSALLRAKYGLAVASIEGEDGLMSSSLLTTQQLSQLAKSGYLSLDFGRFQELYNNYAALFDKTQTYFALDLDSGGKRDFKAPSGPGASEEGYSIIQGEKQIFTCRGYTRTPLMLRDEAKLVWDASGRLMQNVMCSIAQDLQLPADTFEPFLSDCMAFQEKRTPTLLRLFRYDRPRDESVMNNDASTGNIVAEKHKDLGLLSLVVGSTPGLEVFDESTQSWLSIESRQANDDSDGLCITLLVGQTLRYLTRGQYRAGIHRVRCASRRDINGKIDPFRYSIVYALRPYPNRIALHSFENEKVGSFTEEEKAGIDGQSAQVLFNRLCNAHWNVNIAQDIRHKQRQAIRPQEITSEDRFGIPTATTGSLAHDKDEAQDLASETTQKSSSAFGRKWSKLKSRLLPTSTMHPSRVV